MAQSRSEFFESRDWPALESLWGWSVTRDKIDPSIVFLAVKARDGEVYRVRFICDAYPSNAPSVSFVSSSGVKDDPTAWPRATGELSQEVKPPPSCFLCMPLTREGLAHHPEWRTQFPDQVWNANKHTLLDIFNRIQRLLNATYYEGRQT